MFAGQAHSLPVPLFLLYEVIAVPGDFMQNLSAFLCAHNNARIFRWATGR
jgi:hypothetical protein